MTSYKRAAQPHSALLHMVHLGNRSMMLLVFKFMTLALAFAVALILLWHPVIQKLHLGRLEHVALVRIEAFEDELQIDLLATLLLRLQELLLINTPLPVLVQTDHRL